MSQRLQSGDRAKLSITSSDECWDAYWSLMHGDLEPLMQHLERETGEVHPLLQRALANLLRGKHKTHKIEISRQGKGAPRSRDRRMDARIAKYVANSSEALKKNAVADAMTEFGLGRAAIYEALDRHRESLVSLRKFMKAHSASK